MWQGSLNEATKKVKNTIEFNGTIVKVLGQLNYQVRDNVGNIYSAYSNTVWTVGDYVRVSGGIIQGKGTETRKIINVQV